jgi:hypothetical protein
MYISSVVGMCPWEVLTDITGVCACVYMCVCLYAHIQLPEKWYPGKFDFAFNSHQVRARAGLLYTAYRATSRAGRIFTIPFVGSVNDDWSSLRLPASFVFFENFFCFVQNLDSLLTIPFVFYRIWTEC